MNDLKVQESGFKRKMKWKRKLMKFDIKLPKRKLTKSTYKST